MNMRKRYHWGGSIIAILAVVGMLWALLIGSSVQAQVEESTEYDSLHFLVDGGNMYFYEPTRNIVYIYSSRGEFRRAYQLVKLGMRLKSFSSAEIRKMISSE